MALTSTQIQAAFQNSLGRAPSASELSSFTAVSQSGAVSDAGVINAISNSTEADRIADPVVRFYESAFGRVPDQAGLNNAEAYIRAFTPTAQTYQNLAVQFTQSQEFQNRFGSGTTVDAAYVTALYSTILGRTPSSAEVDGFVSGSNGYTTRAQVLYAISQSNEAQGISNNAVNGFLANVASGTAVFTGDLYTSANGAPNGAVSGQTFTLTTATDNLTGTAGGDTFIGNNATLTTADTINGGAGNDTLRIIETGGGTVVPVLTSVERIEVQNFGPGTTETIVLTNSSGYNTLAAVNGNGSVAYTGINAITAAEATKTTGGALSLGYASTAVAGTADVQTLAMNSGSLSGLTTNGIETLAITANNTTSNIGNAITQITDPNADGTVALKAITVAGSGTLTLGGVGTELVGSTVNGVATLTLDASANTGGVTARLGAGTDTVTGGSGNDKFIFADTVVGGAVTVNGLTTADTVVGGAGTDTISISTTDITADSATGNTLTALNTKVSGVEVLELTGATSTVNQSLLTNSELTKILFNTAGADVVTNTVASKAYGLGTSDFGTTTFTSVVSQGNSGQTLNLSFDGSATKNVNTTLDAATGLVDGSQDGTITVNGAVNVNIASTGSFTGDHKITGLTSNQLNDTVTITGNHDLNLGQLIVNSAAAVPGGAAAVAATATQFGDTVNAAALTGKLTLVGSTGIDQITVGSGGSLVTGSAGSDAITLGSGRDQLKYTANDAGTADLTVANGFSTTTAGATTAAATTLDTVTGFTAGTDKFLLAETVTGVNQVTVTGATAANASLGADIATANATLFANGNNAAVVTINGGTNAGTYLVQDTNAGGTFTDGTDFTVKLVGTSGTISASDFTKVVAS